MYLFFSATFVVIVGYLATFFYLMSYLRRFHPTAWEALERPAVPDLAEHAKDPWPFVPSGFLTFIFTFSNEHQPLEQLWWTKAEKAAGCEGFRGRVSRQG